MKKLLFLLTLAVTAMSMSAAPVDQNVAQKKAQNFLTNGVFVELGGCRDGRHYMSPYLYQKGKKAEVGLLFSKEKEASQSCIFLPIVFFRIKKDSKIQCEDISFEFNKETATLTIHNIATFDCSTFNWPVLLERNKSLYRFAYPFLSVCLSKTYHFLMAANTEPKEKPKKKSWWYWIIVLVALGIFASFGILVWPKGETDDPAVIAVMSDLNFDLPNGVKLEMKKISAGTFMMGSPEDERGRFEEEVQHQVNLTNDFWLGQYEVMQAQYEAVMGTNPSKIKGNDLPVDGVSWDDAMAFCEKLNTLYADDSNLPAGYQFTLPTEAQWEYACRAGTTASLNNAVYPIGWTVFLRLIGVNVLVCRPARGGAKPDRPYSSGGAGRVLRSPLDFV